MAQVASARVAVCVFAKPPRAGEAKTRLAVALGEAGAARLAHAFFRDAWSKVGAIDWARPVLATTDEHAEAWDTVRPADLWLQGEGDLGRRMERVFRRALESHACAIIVGTDCPTLPASRFDLARAALESHDAVIGPSDDGGFYLLGLRRCPAGLLAGVSWGSGEAYEQAMDRLRSARLTVAVLPASFDVDRPDDLDRLRRMCSVELSETAPETARLIHEWTNEHRGNG